MPVNPAQQRTDRMVPPQNPYYPLPHRILDRIRIYRKYILSGHHLDAFRSRVSAYKDTLSESVKKTAFLRK